MDPNPDDGEIKAQISEILGAMASLYPSAVLGAEANRSYVRMLQDIPIDVLKIAVDQLCVESKYLPTVAEIWQKVDALTKPATPPALQAWKLVIDKMKRYGINRSVTALKEIEAENSLAAEATRCLGYQELCNSENQVADRAHFSRIYDQLAERRQADDRLLPAARELKALSSGQPIIAQLLGRKD